MPDSSTLWTVARQTPLSMGFSRQECWSGLSCPPQGIFLTQGSNLGLCGFCSVGGFFTTEPAGKSYYYNTCLKKHIRVLACVFWVLAMFGGKMTYGIGGIILGKWMYF